MTRNFIILIASSRRAFFAEAASLDGFGGVMREALEILPDRSLKSRNHSPDGFMWGYGGSGPSQLALALLLELVSEEAALANYQSFKWDIIANLEQDSDHAIPLTAVDEWLEKRGLTRKV